VGTRWSERQYLKGPLGHGGTSIASRTSKKQAPFHHGQTLSTLVFMFVLF